MSMLLNVLSIFFALTVVGLGLAWGYYMYLQRRGADDPSMTVPNIRPAPIINTKQYGPVTPKHFDWETNTSGHATVQDGRGRLRTLSPVHEEELHHTNMLHNVFGNGPPEYEWLPRDHAQQEHSRYAARAGGTSETMKYKHKFDMAETEANLERENTDLELDKNVERAQTLIRANPTMVKK